MKRLCLLRHAKSSWDDRSLSDDQRPLKGRGKRDCKRLGKHLAERGFTTEVALVSPARRAASTARRVFSRLETPLEQILIDELYTFDSRILMREIRAITQDLSDVVIVGHNPAMTELINELANEDYDNLPTCGFAELHCDIQSWRELADGCANLVSMVTPKMFRKEKPNEMRDWVR